MFRCFYPWEYVKNVYCIDFEKLYRLGYRGLIFDIDNTLVHHGDDATPQVEQLFDTLHQSGFKTLLLSNNDQQRIERFNKNINTMFICDAEKPNPESYEKAILQLKLKKNEVLMIGDQIFTDIYGANKAKIPSILVHFIKLKEERRIGIRRHLEFIILWIWKRNKHLRNRMGGIEREVNHYVMEKRDAVL